MKSVVRFSLLALVSFVVGSAAYAGVSARTNNNVAADRTAICCDPPPPLCPHNDPHCQVQQPQ